MSERVRAKDLMQTDVVILAADAPVTEAIETLEEYRIGGAPVVDASGRIVGVFSAADVTRREHVDESGIRPQPAERHMAEPLEEEGMLDEERFSYVDDYNPETLGHETVQDWMSPQFASVAPGDTLRAVCRVMVAESVHRVFVVERGALVGILSSFDVVRHVAGEARSRS
jgi:CBS domain-containing protein